MYRDSAEVLFARPDAPSQVRRAGPVLGGNASGPLTNNPRVGASAARVGWGLRPRAVRMPSTMKYRGWPVSFGTGWHDVMCGPALIRPGRHEWD